MKKSPSRARPSKAVGDAHGGGPKASPGAIEGTRTGAPDRPGAPDGGRYPEPQHTDVHDRLGRAMEILEDAVVVLLSVTLLALALVFMWRVWGGLADLDLQAALSNIIFVVITMELFRLLVHYLRFHRIDLNILVEVGLSAVIQKVILVGIDKFTMQQLIGISLVLLTLGAILFVHLREGRKGRGRW